MGAKPQGRQVYMLYLYLKKAFDRIDHRGLVAALRRMGLPSIYVDNIKLSNLLFIPFNE